MRRGFFSVFFTLAATAVLVAFQNCSQVNYTITGDHSSSSPKVPDLAVSEGGEIYDGKPRILHHYVPGFQCEGRPQPESILLSQDDINWRLIQNSPEKCAVQDKVPVTGVVYNSATNQAVYLGKTYVPPIPFYVDASEDPNLPDKKLEDGVCENVNNKCSLLAAVQQAGVVSYTADSVVEIPPATYSLTMPLDVRLSARNHSVHLRGASGGNKPVLDGRNATNHLYIADTNNGTVIVDQLRFINGRPFNYPGWTTGTPSGSALTVDFRFRGNLTILDSEFSNNRNAPVIDAGPSTGFVTIQRSRFINNQDDYGAVRAYGVGGMLVEDSTFTNNDNGLYAHNLSDVTINRSTFSGSRSTGLTLGHCLDCTVQNSTIYNNTASGLDVWTVEWPEPEASLTVINSTIVQNGQTGASSAPNILVNFRNPIHKLKVFNSVIATNGLGNTNCQFSNDPFYTFTIEATNSLFDDVSCAPTGSDNIIGLSPQLGSFGDHGGLTPTLLPLPGSPLIDAGDNNFCPILDQRGQSRPVDKLGAGPRCDIGAVEVDK